MKAREERDELGARFATATVLLEYASVGRGGMREGERREEEKKRRGAERRNRN